MQITANMTATSFEFDDIGLDKEEVATLILRDKDGLSNVRAEMSLHLMKTLEFGLEAAIKYLEGMKG